MATGAKAQPPAPPGRSGPPRTSTSRSTARDGALDQVMAASRALVGIAVVSLGVLDDDDVTLSQFRALLLVGEGRAQVAGDLAVQLGIHPSNSSRMVDRLVAKGLLARQEGDDRREVHLELTEQGWGVVGHVLQARRVALTTVLDELDDAEVAALGAALGRFAEAAGERADDAWRLGWAG